MKISSKLRSRLESDYSCNDVRIVEEKLLELQNKLEWEDFDRLGNAILELSRGDLAKIDIYVRMAYLDPRDVLMLSESS